MESETMKTFKVTVEEAVKEIGILASDKTVNELTEKDWIVVQNSILLIEAHMHDLIHLYDLLGMREKSNYFIRGMDEMTTIREREINDKEQN